jgi:DNA-binding NtrC family response regulator
VVFEASEVSRLHAVLRADAGRWLVEDLGSANGTTIARAGGAPSALVPHEAVEVFADDVIEVGSSECALELQARAPRAAATDDPTLVSEAARAFARRLDVAARTRVPVFLLGPSGVGKTFSAQTIHDHSRSDGVFVPINCARLPSDPSALHSELLGHVRGAYTGAVASRTGRLVIADGGTLFLDEVESLSELAQGFLLDVLEGSGDLAPLGSESPLQRAPIFRLISASKRPLGDSGLRVDLCERLAEGHMWRLPTLDERRADIPGLVRGFAAQQAQLLGTEVVVTEEAIDVATRASWPGQIRQLRSSLVVLAQMELAERELDDGAGAGRIVLRASALARHLAERGEAWGGADVDEDIGAVPVAPRLKGDARSLSKEHVLAALNAADGNQSEAARRLGVARNTLARKMKSFGITRQISG